MDTKDRQEALLATVGGNFERIDNLLERKLQGGGAAERGKGSTKLIELIALRSAMAEAGTWLGYYLRTEKHEYRARVATAASRLREALARLRDFPRTLEEQRWATELDALFSQTIAYMDDILGLNDMMQKNIAPFWVLRE
jgi:hypothetical protein